MKVKDLLKEENFRIIAGEEGIEKELQGVYIGDLLSWVMAHLQENEAWITIQSHVNVIAVGVLNDAACILLAEGASLDEDAKKKANEENLAVIETNLTAYELAVKVNKLMKENE
ncbi:DRTGG domain-containing protein [Isachenkonia alkalipeptolytica]|uniref:AraC family transcriptional regulator n=1 Tax=Isachenkonia alkalipeptolytica TaxID=2565777 RepID=A0AA44BFA2_9CLOT|nr:AraC family transcriptional regulator [Isachenkonia alkalipeptolytica]